ncbi:MAG: monofunctional biosynthetic peptidoglycan transglycosylase [Bacteroidetes bacterium]|nr:monofunctional biosynthetic peptidoglycan transglycosylase [Bacteroidota bacterium]
MKKFVKFFLLFTKYFLIFFFASSVFFVLLYRFVNPPVTPLMLIRNVQQLISGEPLKLKKEWKSLDEISNQLQLAVVASEDNRFLDHNGFDLEAIKRAKNYNDVKQGKKVRGASTISQQTAKNVFLWPDRTWVRKGLEVYFTFLIETVWGKKRIMEVYLNVIETGDGLYGAEAASRKYFNKPALQLSRDQAALLAAILPNPRKWDPSRPSGYLLSRESWILWNMANIGRLWY